MFEQLAQELIKANAGKLGAVIGTAIGGPVGTAVGGMAGMAIESLAEALGTTADPIDITQTIQEGGTENHRGSDRDGEPDAGPHSALARANLHGG
jgi:outer membrane lipoprotein SlyB